MKNPFENIFGGKPEVPRQETDDKLKGKTEIPNPVYTVEKSEKPPVSAEKPKIFDPQAELTEADRTMGITPLEKLMGKTPLDKLMEGGKRKPPIDVSELPPDIQLAQKVVKEIEEERERMGWPEGPQQNV